MKTGARRRPGRADHYTYLLQLVLPLAAGLTYAAAAGAEESAAVPANPYDGPDAGLVATVEDGETLTLADGRQLRLVNVLAPLEDEPFADEARKSLADLALDVSGVTLEDTYPYPLPDLFAGTQLILTGRYRDGGPATVTLTGQVNGQPRTFRFDDLSCAQRRVGAGQRRAERIGAGRVDGQRRTGQGRRIGAGQRVQRVPEAQRDIRQGRPGP